MTQNILKELAELQKKAAKYDNMKGRYVDYGTKLNTIIKMLQELAQEIDPVGSLGGRERSGINFKEITAEIYEKMLRGVEVSSAFLEKAYPDLNNKHIIYVMKILQKQYGKKVLKRKEGVKVFLYIQKEI